VTQRTKTRLTNTLIIVLNQQETTRESVPVQPKQQKRSEARRHDGQQTQKAYANIDKTYTRMEYLMIDNILNSDVSKKIPGKGTH